MQVRRHRRVSMGLWVAVLFLVSASGSHAWEHLEAGAAANSVLFTAEGDVLSGGQTGDPASGTGDLVVMKHGGPTGTEIWRHVFATGVPPSDSERGLVFLTLQSPEVVLAAYGRGRYCPNFISAVAALDVSTGAPRWRAELPGVKALGLARDQAGDVLVAGTAAGAACSQESTRDEELLVLKLDGASGTEQWRFLLNGEFNNAGDVASGIAVDSTGDVLIAGYLSDTPQPDYAAFTALKLSGDTGALLWRARIGSSSGVASGLVVDVAGDMVAVGNASLIPGYWFSFVVSKLSGVDGSELWRAVLDDGGGNSPDLAVGAAIDPSGDVVATGYLNGSFSTVKLAGATGNLIWRHDIPDLGPASGGESSWGSHIGTNAAGDTFVAGMVAPGYAVVAKLLAPSGAESWRRVFDGECLAFPGEYRLPALALNPTGNVAVAGRAYPPVVAQYPCEATGWPPPGSQYFVRMLTGASGKDFFAGCHDDLDNDGDGYIDYPGDPGCRTAASARENPQCQDAIDNDGDGNLDFDGGASANHGVALGPPDPQCLGKPYRDREAPNTCGLGAEMALVLSLLELAAGRRRRAN